MKRDCFHSAFPPIMSLLKGSISPRNVVISHGEEEKEGRKREGEREREKNIGFQWKMNSLVPVKREKIPHLHFAETFATTQAPDIIHS